MSFSLSEVNDSNKAFLRSNNGLTHRVGMGHLIYRIIWKIRSKMKFSKRYSDFSKTKIIKKFFPSLLFLHWVRRYYFLFVLEYYHTVHCMPKLMQFFRRKKTIPDMNLSCCLLRISWWQNCCTFLWMKCCNFFYGLFDILPFVQIFTPDTILNFRLLVPPFD